MRFRVAVGAAATLLLIACGGSPSTGGSPGSSPGSSPAPSSAPALTTAAAAVSFLDRSAMKDARCDQTGLSSSTISNGNINGTCRISRTGSAYSLLQQYSVTVTAQVETTTRTLVSYVVSLQVGGDTYYRTGPGPTGGTYARSTVTAPQSWSQLFFAGADFSNLQRSSVNGTDVWTVDATTPGLTGVSKTGKLYIRAADGYPMQVDFLTMSGDTTLRTKFGFTAWDTGTAVSPTPPQ